MTTNHVNVDIPALKARHPLGDTVEASGVRLRGTGRVRQGICPFHKELEGSFTVYSDSQRFYCFGCGIGGDVLDFIQRTSKYLSLRPCVAWAAEQRLHLGLPLRRQPRVPNPPWCRQGTPPC